jgi:hypothetical protein
MEHRAKWSTISRASSQVEHLHRSIRPGEAPSARRAGRCQRAEWSIFTGVSEPHGALSARRAEYCQRSIEPNGVLTATCRVLPSIVNELNRALSVEHQPKPSTVRGVLSRAEYLEHQAERRNVNGGTSRELHHQRDIELSGVSSPEHRAKLSSKPNGALSAEHQSRRIGAE